MLGGGIVGDAHALAANNGSAIGFYVVPMGLFFLVFGVAYLYMVSA